MLFSISGGETNVLSRDGKLLCSHMMSLRNGKSEDSPKIEHSIQGGSQWSTEVMWGTRGKDQEQNQKCYWGPGNYMGVSSSTWNMKLKEWNTSRILQVSFFQEFSVDVVEILLWNWNFFLKIQLFGSCYEICLTLSLRQLMTFLP